MISVGFTVAGDDSVGAPRQLSPAFLRGRPRSGLARRPSNTHSLPPASCHRDMKGKAACRPPARAQVEVSTRPRITASAGYLRLEAGDANRKAPIGRRPDVAQARRPQVGPQADVGAGRQTRRPETGTVTVCKAAQVRGRDHQSRRGLPICRVMRPGHPAPPRPLKPRGGVAGGDLQLSSKSLVCTGRCRVSARTACRPRRRGSRTRSHMQRVGSTADL